MKLPIECANCGAQITNKSDIYDYPVGPVCLTCMLASELPGDDFEPEYGYGYFHGGDPRDFTPDYELCMPEEIKAWQRDCALWNAGKQEPCPPPCTHADVLINGEVVGNAVISAPRYGIGTYKLTWED